MDYPQFCVMYGKIIAAAIQRLKPNRFACFTVGDFRGKDGFYCGFTADTIQLFGAAGARLYNSAVLITATGSLPIRAGKAFTSGRKLGRTHQECLIFCKGSWKLAAEACGVVD
jgi:hypothetical protein